MDVAMIGAAMTPFGERDARLQALLAEAGAACLDDADVSPDAVDHLYVSQSGGAYEAQHGLANALASDLSLEPAFAAGIEQTSAAGAAGLVQACQSVASGASDCTLLVGGEKMTHRSTADTTDVVSAITHPAEYRHGITIPSFAGLTARRYLERFDAPRESLAAVAVKNHENGVHNPKAHLQTEIDRQTALESPIVADPLRLYDFCPISDGSAAVLVTTPELAREYTDAFVTITGIAGATSTHVVHERTDLTRLDAVADASRQAFKMAGIEPNDLDLLEVHDMFTILELLQLEAVGIADRGTAWRLAEQGVTARDGEIPVNTSGGLKSKGHPIAASGIAQVVECYEQLLERAGPRQVADVTTALASNVGGFGNCAVTTVLARDR